MNAKTLNLKISSMSTQQASIKQVIVNIGGMGCAGCANSIQEALESKDGVTEVAVDLDNNTASVTYNPGSVSTKVFKQAIEEAGYEFVDVR